MNENPLHLVAKARHSPLADDDNVALAMLLPAQNRSLEMVVRGAPLQEVLRFLTTIVERHAGGKVVAAILLLDEEGCLWTGAAPSLPDAYNAAIDGLKASVDLGTCSVAAVTGDVVVTRDIAADPKWEPIRSLPLDLGLKAAWSQPILARDGRVLGTFGTYFRECREPSPFERQLVETLSHTAALAIERAEADRSLEHQRQMLDLAMEAAQMGTWQYRLDTHICTFSPRAQQLYGAPERFLHDEAGVRDVLHPDDIEGMWAAVKAASDPAGDGRYEVQYRVRAEEGWRWLSVWGLAKFEEEGEARKAVALVGASRDVTEAKEAERQRQLLVDELSHRVKNTLAVVQSIASQTLRRTPDPAEFKAAFGARISALARAHSLLTRTLWKDASLRDVVTTALAPFETSDAADLTLEGPDIRVVPGTALTLILVIHELATNALKHGALQRSTGSVAVTWKRCDSDAARPMLEMLWVERGGPPAREPETSGFGCRLIDISAQQLAGEVEKKFDPEGFRCNFRFACPQ